MQFVRGNAAVRDHVELGKDLHLFEKMPPARWRYLGQMVCASYDITPDSPDTAGNPRNAIVFRLVSLDGPDARGAVPEGDGEPRGEDWYWSRSLDELKQAALEGPTEAASGAETRRKVYYRSMAVKAYVLRRANGHCAGCDGGAPFFTLSGRPYLEPHHTRRVSDGGPDHPGWVIALCPTCHRRAHHSSDHEAFNQILITKVNSLESM